jgi:hypothetical protein
LKIARGLSDLFNFLAVLDDSELPRRGRHEQSAMVMGLPQVLSLLIDRTRVAEGLS